MSHYLMIDVFSFRCYFVTFFFFGTCPPIYCSHCNLLSKKMKIKYQLDSIRTKSLLQCHTLTHTYTPRKNFLLHCDLEKLAKSSIHTNLINQSLDKTISLMAFVFVAARSGRKKNMIKMRFLILQLLSNIRSVR